MDITVISSTLNQLGESPLWHPGEQKLYWLDCFETAIYCYDPANAEINVYSMPDYLGAIAYRVKGGLIATTRYGIATIDLSTSTLMPLVTVLNHDESLRMNEAKCDRAGRLWAGSAVATAADCSASLYCLDSHGSCRRIRSGLMISNGMGWSPDNRVLYHNDSLAGIIRAYDFDLRTAGLSGERQFFYSQADGQPDGLTVDCEGGVWVAFWEGGTVCRFKPNGELDLSIPMPVSRPTSVMFGGKDLSTLYVTSCNHIAARDEKPQASPNGALFAIKTDYVGLKEPGYDG